MKTKSIKSFICLLLLTALTACNMPLDVPNGGQESQTVQERSATQTAYANESLNQVETANTIEIQPVQENTVTSISSDSQVPTQPIAVAPTLTLPATQVPPAPTQPVQPTQPPPPSPTVVMITSTSGYAELRHNETIDMDFNGSGDEMAYLADSPDNQIRGHAIGQYVGDGSGIGFALMSSIPSYETCQAVTSWNPGIMIDEGNIFCYKTWGNTYGYIQIDKIQPTGDTEIPAWVMGFSYTTWSVSGNN